VVDRMRTAQSRGEEAAKSEGMEIAHEMAAAVLPLVRGVHLSTPAGEVGPALEVIEPWLAGH